MRTSYFVRSYNITNMSYHVTIYDHVTREPITWLYIAYHAMTDHEEVGHAYVC